MKKVLIVSYYFPPYTGIEGHRAFSWYTHFKKTGFWPCIVTRHWKEGAQQTWKDYQTDSGETLEINRSKMGEIHRLPYRANSTFTKFNKIPLLRGIYYWIQKILGNVQIETDAYVNFYEYCRKLCIIEKPDFILVTSPPLNIIRIASKLYDEFEIPYAVDFRDAYNNNLLNSSYQPSLRVRMEDFMFKYYIKKWLKNASFFVGVSKPVNNLTLNIIEKPSFVITNGFDAEVFNTITFIPDDIFRITIMGTIYIIQDVDFMIKGFNLFLNSAKRDDILIQFIGLGQNSLVGKKIIQNIDGKYLHITDRLPRKQAFKYFNSTSMLYFLGWLGYKGIYSGKLFEYLGTGLPILIAPGDRDVMDELLKETEAGLSAISPEEMSRILNEWYSLWSSKNKIPVYPNPSVKEYTRESQAILLSDIIKKHVSA